MPFRPSPWLAFAAVCVSAAGCAGVLGIEDGGRGGPSASAPDASSGALPDASNGTPDRTESADAGLRGRPWIDVYLSVSSVFLGDIDGGSSQLTLRGSTVGGVAGSPRQHPTTLGPIPAASSCVRYAGKPSYSSISVQPFFGRVSVSSGVLDGPLTLRPSNNAWTGSPASKTLLGHGRADLSVAAEDGTVPGFALRSVALPMLIELSDRPRELALSRSQPFVATWPPALSGEVFLWLATNDEEDNVSSVMCRADATKGSFEFERALLADVPLTDATHGTGLIIAAYNETRLSAGDYDVTLVATNPAKIVEVRVSP